MLLIRKQIYFCLGIFLFLFTFSNLVKAQNILFNYNYKLEPAVITAAPEFIGSPEINYPDEARKNGVEGTLKASFTIAEDGSTQNIVIEQSLPNGVDDAVKTGLQKLRFKPAKFKDKPVAVKMYFDYIVSAVYDERDKNVGKPKITSQSEAVYPSKYLAEKLKGEVLVAVMCNADGTVKVMGTNSVMPKEFDVAAREAAAKIKFEPAMHKKSKKAVSQQITVKYKFKP
jgi:TonB family protein